MGRQTLKNGRIAMSDEDVIALCLMTKDAKTYVEIGTLWGGSAIEVALANPELRLWCIDIFDGYYGGVDHWSGGQTPSLDMVRENLEFAGVADRTTLVKAKSDPFPLAGMEFDAGFIDGDHSADAVLNDWINLSSRCRAVAFHDVDDPAVAGVIEKYVRADGDWKQTYRTRRLICFKRRED